MKTVFITSDFLVREDLTERTILKIPNEQEILVSFTAINL